MGLVTCPDCGKRVSEKASVCPNCGSPIATEREKLVREEEERVAKAEQKKEEIEKEHLHRIELEKNAAEEKKKKEQEVYCLRDQGKLKKPAVYSLAIALNVIPFVIAIIGNISYLVATYFRYGITTKDIFEWLVATIVSILMLLIINKARYWHKYAIISLILLSALTCITFLKYKSFLAFGPGLMLVLWTLAMVSKVRGIRVWNLLVKHTPDAMKLVINQQRQKRKLWFKMNISKLGIVFAFIVVVIGMVVYANSTKYKFPTNDGIITDRTTKLEWIVCPESNLDWDNANEWIDSLEDQWRMPTISELEGLWDSGISSESWGPFENDGASVWSSSTSLFADGEKPLRFSYSYGTPCGWSHSLSSNRAQCFAVR